MASLERLKEILGAPPVGLEGDFLGVERELGVELPVEVKEVGSVYGDLLISDFIFIFGPKFMVEKGVWMSEYVRDGEDVIPRGVLPEVGGMLHWGHSIEGDKFFLERREGGKWTVSAFRRNWGDWYESDDGLIDWMVKVFEGKCAVDWMPEWPAVHWFEGSR
ncbi:hypothetical protein [Streptomyces sp. NBC_00103]|nr:hypothetical protein [Streptomyces sp. NBC_00103]MCX5374795.1 hypothetical protein [Streptomyces sp. NBC_00103]